MVTAWQCPQHVGVSQNPLHLTPVNSQPDYSGQRIPQNYSDSLSLNFKELQPTFFTFVLPKITSWLPCQPYDLASAKLITEWLSQEGGGLDSHPPSPTKGLTPLPHGQREFPAMKKKCPWGKAIGHAWARVRSRRPDVHPCCLLVSTTRPTGHTGWPTAPPSARPPQALHCVTHSRFRCFHRTSPWRSPPCQQSRHCEEKRVHRLMEVFCPSSFLKELRTQEGIGGPGEREREAGEAEERDKEFR